MYNLLVAEDEPKMRIIIRDYFEKKGFAVWEAEDGVEALKRLGERTFDLVLLDVMMPELDGFAVCKAIRRKGDTPVIFLTARMAEEDQLRGFQVKADDYVTKPFSLPVLHAKVCAILERREVTVDGEKTAMPPKVFDLLVYFMENKNRILTREQILDQVWGEDAFCYDRAVDTTIKKLRQALGRRAGCIRTIVKVGYKFQEVTDEQK